ncbi:hypothetical protein AYO44_14555 [Planctomycetaceae bacterium SCGC AG-212-F19]|nr:hypothetical protein AYO44_14555 [Planctomycetaceae bacterium SCGC AG-212-F19]
MRQLVGVVGLLALALSQAGPVAGQSKKTAELIKDLDDKNPKIRSQAVVDIGDLADVRLADAKAALPKLKELQKDTDAGVRKAVVEALGKIEPDQYATLLIDTLKTDKDPAVQLAAVQAVQRLGPMAKAAVAVLQEVHKTSLSEPPPKTTAKTPPANPNMPPADPPAVRRAILGALAAVEPDVKGRMTFMIEVLKPEKDPGVRLTLVQALGQIGPPAKDAVPALVEVQKASLAESLKATAPKGQQPDLDPQNVRRAILQTLARIEPEPKEQTPRWIDALKTDKAPTVRLAAVQALGQIGPTAKEAVPVLLDAHKGITPTDGPGFRKAVVDALLKVQPEPKEQVPLLTELLKREKNSAGRLPLVQGLGEIGPPAKSAIPILLEVQKASPPTPKVLDPDGVRKAILDAIGKIDPEPKSYVPILVDAVKKDRDNGVRQTALAALKGIGAPAKEAVPAVQELIKTLSKSTRAEDKSLAQDAETTLKALQGS